MVRNFSRGLLDAGLPDRAITRDLKWGIPVPLKDDPDAEGKVLYVWFDAPIGYVSFTAKWCERETGDWKNYERWWKDPEAEIVHFIGEDNVVFHSIMWPAMLMAEGSFQLPSQVVANCFLNIQFPGEDEKKMSTSRGTAVWIGEYLAEYDPDPLRYYLTMIAPEDQRTAFQFDDFVSRNNDELVANFGNLVHRTITFVHKYFDARVPTRGQLSEKDRAQLESLEDLPRVVGEHIENYRFKNGMQAIMSASSRANQYFDHRKPWVLRKEDREECGTVLNVLLNTIKTLGVVVEPYLPFAAEKIGDMLSCTPEDMEWNAATQPLQENSKLNEPEILFEKLE
jgi:methionyl-tRNA synthetase